MKPSKEAISVAIDNYFAYSSPLAKIELILDVAYAIDVAPLERRIEELKTENERLKKLCNKYYEETKEWM